jgi:hypothetical protein
MNELRDKLASRIERRLAKPVRLAMHDNQKVMLSFRHAGGGVVGIRLHHMFLSARLRDVNAIVRYLKTKDPEAKSWIEGYIARYRHLIGVKLPEPAKGAHYDLERIYGNLNRRFFRNRVKARIVWGRRVKRERKRTIRLGYYCDNEKKIVISPTLDRRSVPRYFLEWIVFHEMLHQVVGFTRMNGVLVAHTPEFRRREQAFPHYPRASAWESRNLSRLLRA